METCGTSNGSSMQHGFKVAYHEYTLMSYNTLIKFHTHTHKLCRRLVDILWKFSNGYRIGYCKIKPGFVQRYFTWKGSKCTMFLQCHILNAYEFEVICINKAFKTNFHIFEHLTHFTILWKVQKQDLKG